MDWIKQNKFLAVWLAITILGAGAMGYLYLSAKGAYTEAQENFTTKVGELQNLQNQNPFPEDENLKKMLELQKAHQASIETLRQQLSKNDLAMTPLSAVKFQDELRESVKRVLARAGEKGTKMPDNFYMAFTKYQSSTPPEEIAPALGRMLKAMELAITTLIDQGANEIADLKREEFPEEGGPKAAAATTPPSPGGKDKDKDKDALVRKTWFEVSFIAAEPRFRGFLNELVSSKTQFFVPRSVVIENEKLVGPSKIAAAASGTSNDPVAAAPNTPAGTAALSKDMEKIIYVVGDERLKITLRVDVIDFVETAPLTSTK